MPRMVLPPVAVARLVPALVPLLITALLRSLISSSDKLQLRDLLLLVRGLGLQGSDRRFELAEALKQGRVFR